MLYSRNEEYRTNLVNRFPYHIEISQGFYLSFTPTRTNQSTFVFDSHCGINTGRHEPNLYSLIMQLNTVACVQIIWYHVIPLKMESNLKCSLLELNF